MRKILVLVVLLLLGLGATGAWIAWGSTTPAFDGERGVRIPPGSSFETATDSLVAAGLLDGRSRFELFASLTGWDEQVKPGHYLFPSGVSNWEVLDKIRKGLQDPIRVTIPPGVRPGRLAAVLERQLGTDSTAMRAAFRDQALAEELGTDTLHLFGHMRANTYDIYWTTDAKDAVRRIHGWHDRYWTEARRAQADAMGLTPDEVITMASIVEWEARDPEERPRVAGVYLNRLLGRTASGTMRLQADPTVQYALMEADGGPMRRLFFADYQFPSPYNTYLIDGLPPGPINNPSESSIEAVLAPEDHEFLYFVADGTGRHRFSRTLGEHNRAAAEWSRFLTEQVRIRQQREDSLRRAEQTP